MRLLYLRPFRPALRTSLAVLIALSLIRAAAPSRAEEELAPIEVPSSTVTLAHKGSTISAQAFSPDGGVLAVGMTDGSAALYNLKAKRWTVQTGRLQSGGIQAVALSPGGSLMAACGDDNCVAIVNACTGKSVRRLPTSSSALCIAFSPHGRLLAAGLQDDNGIGKIQIWSVPTMRLQQTLEVNGPVFALSFSASGDRLLAAANDSVVFTLPAGKKIWSHDNEGARTAAISADGKIVGGGQEIWSVDRNKQIAGPRGQNNFSGFSRTGGILVSGSQEDGASVLDGHSGKLLAELHIFGDFCAVSPDATLVADGYSYIDVTLYHIDETAIRKLAYDHKHLTKQQIKQKKLVAAVEQSDLASVKQALKKGADPNVRPSEYGSLLTMAALHGNLPIFQALVNGGARFTTASAHTKALMLRSAVAGGCVPLVRWLTQHGAPIPAKDDDLTLVFVATEHRDTAMIAYLLDHGAPIDAREPLHGETALITAAEHENAVAVRLLLRRGADPKLKTRPDLTGPDPFPENALSIAIQHSDLATVALLIAATPRLNDPIAFPRPLAFLAISPNSADILTLLLEKGANPNATTTHTVSPLISAICNGASECVAALIAHHVDVNAKDHDGKTALDWSTNPAITKMLTDAGAKSGRDRAPDETLTSSLSVCNNRTCIFEKGAYIPCLPVRGLRSPCIHL